MGFARDHCGFLRRFSPGDICNFDATPRPLFSGDFTGGVLLSLAGDASRQLQEPQPSDYLETKSRSCGAVMLSTGACLQTRRWSDVTNFWTRQAHMLDIMDHLEAHGVALDRY